MITGTQIDVQDLIPSVRSALTEAIDRWLNSNPGVLSPEQERLSQVYPFLYEIDLMP